MKRCPNCGREDDGVFCSRCGYRLEAVSSALHDNQSTDTLQDMGPSAYLFLKASSYEIGIIHEGTISESWDVYSDGSYQIRSSIVLADRTNKEVIQKGNMSTDQFCELCHSIDEIKWSDSFAMVDGGHLYQATICDDKGIVVHYGDYVTTEHLEEIIGKLPKTTESAFSQLMEAYRQSKVKIARQDFVHKSILTLLLLTCIFVFILLNACGNTDIPENTDETTDNIENEDTTIMDAPNGRSDIDSLISESLSGYGFYALADLNNDKIPEVFATDEDNILYPGIYDDFDDPLAVMADVFTIKDGELYYLGSVGDGTSELCYNEKNSRLYTYGYENDAAYLDTYYMDDYSWDDDDQEVLLSDILIGPFPDEPLYDTCLFLRYNVTNGADSYEDTELDRDEFNNRYNVWMEEYLNSEELCFKTIG